ncbi:MAG: ATP-binding cassette domain-containing protein, partial [Alphaproteobacteria bacterium]|nr:ATP-binding cassette domain-containing protein [Alphaproteobacteria bacterium]
MPSGDRASSRRARPNGALHLGGGGSMTALVEAREVGKTFDLRRGLRRLRPHAPGTQVRAVNGVDLSIEPGETVGLIGESGSGKSTLGRLILRLQMPTTGAIRFDGIDLASIPPEEMTRLRRRM